MKIHRSLLPAMFVLTTVIQPVVAFGCDCEHAKDYRIVKKADIKEVAPGRTYGHWYITSTAETHIEFAHTVIQAVMNVYNEHKADLTYVSIVPTENLISSVSCGWGAFAADSLGGLGLSGADQSVKWDWHVFVGHAQITKQKIDIAEMWVAKAKDFPTKDMSSSCLVDTESLRKYIAQQLNMSYEKAVLPTIRRSWYRY